MMERWMVSETLEETLAASDLKALAERWFYWVTYCRSLSVHLEEHERICEIVKIYYVPLSFGIIRSDFYRKPFYLFLTTRWTSWFTIIWCYRQYCSYLQAVHVITVDVYSITILPQRSLKVCILCFVFDTNDITWSAVGTSHSSPIQSSSHMHGLLKNKLSGS